MNFVRLPIYRFTYKQYFGLAMGNPQSVILGNILKECLKRNRW